MFYFKQLFNGKLEVDYSYVWDLLPRCCSLIHPLGLTDDILKAVADDKIVEILADIPFMNKQVNRSVKEVLDELKEDEDYSLISEEDVISLEEWVGKFTDDEDDENEYLFDEDYDDEHEDEMFKRIFHDEYEENRIFSVNVPYKRENFVGRNDPCPCGSGKKYKKCCLGKEN